jgi:hypothetical protein
MKYPKIISMGEALLLFALSAPVAWGQARSATGSAAPAMQDSESTASAMDQDVSRRINQAWSEGKDASGAEAFQENGEIALSEGKEHEAKGYFRAALGELAAIEGDQRGGVTMSVYHLPPDKSASAMDQDVSRKIKQAWAQGKDASGALAFQENGEIALSEGKEQEAKKHFQAAEQELARIGVSPDGSDASASQ